MIEQVVFYAFATITVLASAWVVIAKNPVRAVLSMVLAFIACSALWLLLESEFLAMILILVYVGAVMVLFLFVVMMLQVNIPTFRESFVQYVPLSALIAGTFLGLLLLAVGGGAFDLSVIPEPQHRPLGFSNAKHLGEHLYTQFILPFEVAGVVLLVAMIAAISLTFRGTRQIKKQKPSDQIMVKKAERLDIVKVPSEKGWNEGEA